MNTEFFLPLIIFVITMSITPGPNNIMLTASGANFGYIKTLPHILGIIFGISILNILSALGLSKIFTTYPNIQKSLKYVGMVYMLYLAFKIARSTTLKDGKTEKKPLNFFQAMLFQALNPKAVIMSITAITLYTLKGDLFLNSVYYIIIIFLIGGFCSISLWALFGTLIKSALKNIRYLKLFNYTMGIFCGVSALLLLKQH